jgi:hypothetical protein
VEAWEIEELEEEWVDEGVWAEEASEDFGRRMFLCNICMLTCTRLPGTPAG